MATVQVILYTPVIEKMRGWNGEIGKSTLQLCRRMRFAQRRLAPRKTGRLRRSIEIGYLGHWAGGIETHVGANPANGAGPIGVGWWQEKGTRPHPIVPKNHTHLVFFWPKVGHVVHLRKVRHPGNPATHWAMEGAAAGMAAWR